MYEIIHLVGNSFATNPKDRTLSRRQDVNWAWLEWVEFAVHSQMSNEGSEYGIGTWFLVEAARILSKTSLR